MMTLVLPSDVLILIMEHLSVQQLARFAISCRFFNSLVAEYGWSNYLRSRPYCSNSLKGWRQIADAYTQVRYNTLSDRSFAKQVFVARSLSRSSRNPEPFRPVLAINDECLVVATGHVITEYAFGPSRSVEVQHAYTVKDWFGQKNDITAISFVPSSSGRAIAVGFGEHFGCVELPSLGRQFKSAPPTPLNAPAYLYPIGAEDVACSKKALLTISSRGTATFSNGRATHQLEIGGSRAWSCYLQDKASSPYFAIGTASTSEIQSAGLNVYGLHQFESRDPLPLVKLAAREEGLSKKPHAVNSITSPPLMSSWGANPNVIVSGWYNGSVKIHDLRSRQSDGTLGPVLSLADRMSEEAIYSVSCGGGSGSHIAAGTGRHSTVMFWDVRAPQSGWTTFGPGHDRSPVYKLVLESSRLFGVTDRRTFLLDFGDSVGAKGVDHLIHFHS